MAANRIERTYRVRFDEAGPDGHLRSSGYLRYAQDLAWIHSETGGFGRDWYAARGLTWLVRAIELEITSDTEYGGDLVVSTEVIGFRRVWARRRSEFRTPDTNQPTAVALTDWVLLNARGAPTSVPNEIVDAFVGRATDYNPMRLTLPSTPPDARTAELTVRRSELDPMAHVNNAAYLDYLDEHLSAAAGARTSLAAPRRYEAIFVASAEPGARLIGTAWRSDGQSFYRLSDNDTELLRAKRVVPYVA